MSQESAERFYDDVVKMINYFRNEFELTYPETIGILSMLIMDINEESRLPEEEENGESVEEGNQEA